MREWYLDYFVLGLPTIGLHEYHPDYYQLSHSWLYSIGGGLRFQSNQPYLSPIQHLSQRFPENKGCKIGVDKKILICFRYYLQNEVHVALLDVKWVILHRKFALKICTIHSWYGNLIIFSLVQAIVVKLRIWAYAKTSISSNCHCGSQIMLKGETSVHIIEAHFYSQENFLPWKDPFFWYLWTLQQDTISLQPQLEQLCSWRCLLWGLEMLNEDLSSSWSA